MLNQDFLIKLKTNSLPKRYFGKNEQTKMREVDLASFLYWYDKSLIVREGTSYRLATNRSVVLHDKYAKDFARENSNAKGEVNPCTGIDFCIQYLGLTVSQSMYVLWEYINRPSPTAPPLQTSLTAEDLERRLSNGTYRKAVGLSAVYGYLVGTRKIHPSVIRRLQQEDLLYAEPLTKGYNVLLAMRNGEEEIVGFESSGILSNKGKRYKGSIVAIPYSGFNLQISNSVKNEPSLVLAFESAIDVASFLSLVEEEKMILPQGINIWAVSMRGLTFKVVEQFIDDTLCSSCEGLGLCVDNDEAGQRFCKMASDRWSKYPAIDFTRILAAYHVKDWNELLQQGTPAPIVLKDWFDFEDFYTYDPEGELPF